MNNIFDRYYARYDAWYDKNKYAYLSELEAIKKVLPQKGKGLEIGVGTGRFAARLGVAYGVEPSERMAALAKARGVNIKVACGENIPFENNKFDYVLMVITISFVKSANKVLSEAKRILKTNGKLIIGIIDKNSFLGRFYQKKKGIFYKSAHFFTVDEIIKLLKKASFSKFSYYQTLFKPLEQINSTEEPKKGFGQGGFVVILAT